MPTPLFVFGAGPHGRVVRDVLVSAGLPVTGFIDDRPDLVGLQVAGLIVTGAADWLARPEAQAAALGIGNSVARLDVINRIRAAGHAAVSAVHASAVVASGVHLGPGSFVGMLAGVGTGCTLAAGVVVNTAASVDHDGVLEDGAYLSPGVCCAGAVRVGARAFVGAGATLGPGVHVGHDAIIGAGSVVLSDVPAHGIAYGVPARIRGVREPGVPLDWRSLLGGKNRRGQ